ncbi:hypothetical protein [Pontibacter oryzae]|uniref:Lipoprotein n=1 Tax=Pontibacter oryzae TaxID=2304593 RepID=A0A399S480_9BACT|nr:hypothetical protein [Pontibacter oryzae]RIJ36872.1 hypothetical protein D1627_13665 [Pontibacter oryzae]
MRVTIAYLFAFLATRTLAACGTTEKVGPTPEPVDKMLTFEVSGNHDFSYSRYGEEQLTMQLIISRKEKYEPDAIGKQVFDSALTMPLTALPLRANRLVIKKLVPAVVDVQESIFVTGGYHCKQTAFGKNYTFHAERKALCNSQAISIALHRA